MDRVDIAKKDYDPKVSRIPELIGRHPGVIAPLVIWKPNPLQLSEAGKRVTGERHHGGGAENSGG